MALSLAVLALAGLACAQSCRINSKAVSYPAPEAADGWSYRLVVDGLTRPRGLLFDSDGALIVVDSGVGIVKYEINDNGGTCVNATDKQTLVDDEDLNHGLQLSEDGETLYASTENDVYAWSYGGGSLDGDSRRTLVTNMSNSDHTTRTLLLSRKVPGTLLVSRGSDSNVDADAEDKSSGHSQIRAFNISGMGADSEPLGFLDGDLLGWGLRNSVGVAEHPSSGGVFSVENSVDELRHDGDDIHENNPGEELNFHGYISPDADGPKRDQQGGNYGYPVCLAVWDAADFEDDDGITVGSQIAGGEASSLSDQDCNDDYVRPELVFQAHTAPLDIKFNENGTEAYIAFHGSWNRDDPVGYQIASVAFNSDGMPSSKSDSRSAATPIISTPDLGNCPDDCFRPAGLAWDSEGRLWFTSDSTGEIFVAERSSSADDDSEGGESGDDNGDDSMGAQIKAAGWAVGIGAVIAGLFLA